MELLHLLVVGSYVWTTTLAGVFGKLLLSLYRLVTNDTHHRLESLEERVQALETRGADTGDDRCPR